MNKTRNKISFGLVVYNEEKLISRCLESIKDIADEILIVHDGDCDDNTLNIVSNYTDKIFVRGHKGGSDPHRIFLLKQAKNDWIFMIDADEYLSKELKEFLKMVNLNKSDCSAYAFKWPIWNGEKYVTYNNFRPCLFNKNKCWAISLHNFSTQVIGDICRNNNYLEHKSKTSKFGLSIVKKNLNDRIKRDANQFLIGYDKLEKFNEELIPSSFKKWFKSYLKFPLFYAFFNFFKHFFGSFKNNIKDGPAGFVVSMQLAIYQLKLGIKIWKIKRKLKSR